MPDFNSSVEKLKKIYPLSGYSCSKQDDQTDLIYAWPGKENEDILICAHQCNGIQEPFHHHDYFFFNYTYLGEYDTFSQKYDHILTVHENELYAGQPWAAHALCVHNDQTTTIIGVLIRKETFYRVLFPLLTSSTKLFHFFSNPMTNQFSDEFLHFKIEDSIRIRDLIEIMVIEYANPQSDTQSVLLSIASTFLLLIARQYQPSSSREQAVSLAEQFYLYICEHFNTVTLPSLSAEFSYHPNYVSALLSRKYGKTFSQILLEQRMSHALTLLEHTTLTIDQIAEMIGYNDKSNFHKVFRKYYGKSPRTFIDKRHDLK